MIIIIWLVIFSCFLYTAIIHEKNDQKNAYSYCSPNKKDKINKILNKIKQSLFYEYKTIKWRRIYISTICSIFFVYLFVFERYPSVREIIMMFLIIYTIFYTSVSHYMKTTVKDVTQTGLTNLAILTRLIKNSILNNVWIRKILIFSKLSANSCFNFNPNLK